MSGIVGIVNLDGAPVDERLLSRMTASMTFRGPDAQRTWVGGSVGFGHTLLKTTYEAEREWQPFSFDGQAHIVADCRIDAREELVSQLKAKGRPASLNRPDVELILHAWHVWGEECVQHLLGDFAFSVWDQPRQRLFCARDHLGAKPFFHAWSGQTIIFSNTLDCIRKHPAVSNKLNDLAIADFLLFDMNQDPATTTFADIQRIPPAHLAVWSAVTKRLTRYWNLSTEDPAYFRRTNDYVDRFRELLQVAVDDRIRTHRIGVFMSGGLDSPTLAATACQLLRGRAEKTEVLASTTVIDGLDGNERYYAEEVARYLRVPIRIRDLSDRLIDPEWDKAGVHTPEPMVNPTNLLADRNEYRSASEHSRVWFYGEGPDNALRYEWRSHLAHLVRKRRFGRLIRDVCGHMLRHRRIPLLPSLPRMLRAWGSRGLWYLAFPEWLEPSFERRLRLRARWEEYRHLHNSNFPESARPQAYHSFSGARWEPLFRDFDPGETGVPFEVRHPFLDLRLVQFMLAVPAVPWCRAKYLLRLSMQGALPVPVLRRPKSPLTSDPAWQGARRFGLAPLTPARALYDYVDPRRVPQEPGESMVNFRTNFRPLALNYWLRNLSK